MTGLCDELARTGRFPPVMGRRVGRISVGLLAVSAAVVALVIVSDLSSIASLGSAVALVVFTMISIGHLRILSQTGARLSLVLLAVLTAGISLLVFVFTTLIEEPASIALLVGLVAASIVLDLAWSQRRRRGADATA
jgi:hypothetical protein